MGATDPALDDLLRGRHVYRPRLPRTLPPPTWGLGELAGRLVQLSAPPDGALLTVAVGLVLEAQRTNEPVAWIGMKSSTFYPPDLAESGIDLEALAVIRAAGPGEVLRAADRLLRSGAFGLLVLDLAQYGGASQPVRELPLAAQTRLAGLVQRHDTTLLCLTNHDGEERVITSLGSLISLHASATRSATRDGRFRCEVRVHKDKRRGPGWQHHEEDHCGPPGLR